MDVFAGSINIRLLWSQTVIWCGYGGLCTLCLVVVLYVRKHSHRETESTEDAEYCSA